MSLYVDEGGFTGAAFRQSVIWHYKQDLSRNLVNRWFVNIFEAGVLKYVPSASGASVPPVTTSTVTIAAGTSFLIKEKAAVSPDERIAKVDIIIDHVINVATGYADATYSLIAVWENAADEYRGCEFSLVTVLPSDNYVKFGEVLLSGGVVQTNTITGQTQAGMCSGLLGYSGISGYSGASGIGLSGFSGYSGTGASMQGYSGTSGYSAASPGASGYSGYSSNLPGVQGTSGYSGKSGYSGLAGTECILLTCSDETTPITTGTKVVFRMPYAMTLSKVKVSLTTPGTTSTEINVRWGTVGGVGGTSIFSSLPIITSGLYTTVATSTISTASLADNEEITAKINLAGTSATGCKIYLIGTKS